MINISNILVHKKGGKAPMNLRKKQSGFTIIEVVLVLAIAGLIFIMVFTALPALQRNQRDADRKNEVARVLAAAQSFESNNRGVPPAGTAVDMLSFSKYLDASVSTSTPTTIILASGHTVTKTTSAAPAPTIDDLMFAVGMKCGTSGNALVTGSARQISVVAHLENGDAYYCTSS
jgi:prepilin-type N-terminal cleavage/methylation domain-containing protein